MAINDTTKKEIEVFEINNEQLIDLQSYKVWAWTLRIDFWLFKTVFARKKKKKKKKDLLKFCTKFNIFSVLHQVWG